MTQGPDHEAPAAELLRLMALDAEDLAVLSAHLQDAILRVGDMLFLPQEKRFVLALNRFDWLAAAAGRRERVQAGLHFERVLGVARQGFHQDRPNDLLNLLSIEFTPGEAPSGAVVLTFSGGCALKLEVECLEARMADLGPRWPARWEPGHKVAETPEQ
jgi:hypothetical protein